MKKIILSTVIIFILIITACAATKKTTKPKGTTYAKIERTACFGRCPNYSIEVYSNGLVRYTGRMFADPSGTYEKNIGATKAQKLLKKFDTYRVDTCSEVYENRIPDLPGLIIHVTYKGKEKEIHNASFGPDFLDLLAKDMDAVSTPKEEGWKKTADYKEQ